VDRLGDEHASRLRQGFKPGRNVDAIPIDPFLLDDDIAEVNADAKFHAAVERQLCVPEAQFVLDSDCALHRLHHTGKFCQQVIPRGVHDATPVLLDEGGHEVTVRG
jgi:hypothetical protein